MMQDPKKRFSDRVDNYKKYRPSYPYSAAAFAKAECALPENCAIADIGSGTGISTEVLLDVFNCPVYAVEPNLAMRSEAEKKLGTNPFFHSIDGSSENTTLPDRSVNLVAAFQAFHWFDRELSRPEFRRILKEPRWILLVWNDRMTNGSDFLNGYDAILRELPDYQSSNHKHTDMKIIRDFTGTARVITSEFPNGQRLDFEGLIGRFFSSSYTPKAGTEEYHKQIVKLEKLFEKTNENGVVEFLYNTEIFLAAMA